MRSVVLSVPAPALVSVARSARRFGLVVFFLFEIVLTVGCGKTSLSEAADQPTRKSQIPIPRLPSMPAGSFGSTRDTQEIGPLFGPAPTITGDLTVTTADSDGPGLRDTPNAAGLFEALHDPDLAVRRRAVKALGELGDPRAMLPLMRLLMETLEELPDIQAHLEALKSNDWARRSNAAGALGRLPDKRAVEPLIEALKDRSHFVRAGAAESLGNIGDPRAVEALTAALKDEDRDVRLRAVEALGSIRTDRAKAGLRLALHDSDWLVSSQAQLEIQNLRGIPRPLPTITDSEFRINAVEALGQLGDPRAEPLLKALKKDKDAEVRVAAGEALHRLREKWATRPQRTPKIGMKPASGAARLWNASEEELLAALNDPAYRETRYNVAQRLGQIKARSAVEPLIAGLEDEHDAMRSCSARSLGQIGDPRAIEPIVRLFGDSSYSVREAAIAAAGAMGPEAIDAIGVALQAKGEVAQVAAAQALGLISHPRSVDLLIAALKDKGKRCDVRKKAAESLAKLKATRAIDALIAVFDDTDSGGEGVVKPPGALFCPEPEIQGAAHDAVAAMGSAAIGPLKELLEHEDPHLRKGAVKTLSKMKTPESLDLVISAFDDDSLEVRQEAMEVLEQSTDPRAVRLLERARQIEVLVAALGRDETHIRKPAKRELPQFGAEAVVPVTALLKFSNPEVRCDAADILGEFDDQRAVTPLLQVLIDKSWDVREAACDSLDRLGWRPERAKPSDRAWYYVARQKWDSAASLGKVALEPLIDALRREEGIDGSSAEELRREESIRSGAAGALPKLGSVAVEPVIEALESSNEKVRAAAGTVLGEIGDRRAVEPLIATLDPPRGIFRPRVIHSPLVRRSVAEALGRIGDRRAVDPLLDVLSDWCCSQTAAEALQRLEWEPQNAKQQVHLWIAERDGRSLKKNWEQTRAVLLEDMRSRDFREVENAVNTAISLGSDELIPQLQQVLWNRIGSSGESLATSFLNCGQPKLRSSAKRWTEFHNGKILKAKEPVHTVPWGTW